MALSFQALFLGMIILSQVFTDLPNTQKFENALENRASKIELVKNLSKACQKRLSEPPLKSWNIEELLQLVEKKSKSTNLEPQDKKALTEDGVRQIAQFLANLCREDSGLEKSVATLSKRSNALRSALSEFDEIQSYVNGLSIPGSIKKESIRRYTTQSGRVIGESFAPGRRSVWSPIEEMPESLIKAFVASEDARFFHHHGVDENGIMRAFLKGFVQSGRPEGGSTITQQLARVLFLNQDLSLQRKYKEILIARKLESNWTKNQILEVYLNRIYLGRGTWGVGLAAQQYFGKEVSELKLHESAFLAGIANGPNYYEPTENSKRALQRRSYVLKQMQNAGWISSRERALASKKAIGAKSSWIPAGIQKGGHFQQLARSEFNELFKGRNLSKYQGSGFEVVTTLHESLQEELERALRDGLIAYEERTGRHEWRGPMIYLNYEVNRRIEKLNKEQEEIAEKEKRVKELQSSSVFSLFQSDQSKEKATSQPQKSVFDRAWLGVFQEMTRIHRAALPHLKETPWKKAMILEAKEDDIYSIGFLNGDKGVLDLNAKVSLQGKKYPRDQKWVLSRHPNPRIAQLELGDVVWVERNDEGRFELRQVPEVQGAAIAMDPKTGRILAMSGSFDYGTSPFNRAVQAKRRIGSTMKTFSYMAALESGLQPDHLISNQPIEFDPIVQGGKAWRPSNYSGEYSSCHSMRYGLTRSKNVMTARLLKQMSESPRESLDFVRSISKDFGLYDDPIRQYPFVLGAQETSLLKLVTAYARIANGGVKVKARAIDRIKEVSGESTLYSADEREHGRISEVDEVSILQTKNLLKGVLSHGTASRLSKWSGEMAGKTGTTDDFNDAWFVAFTDHLVVGAWVGYDNAEIESARNLGSRQTGSKVALPIVEDIFEGSMESYKEISPLSTLNSKEVVSVEVNPKTGRQVEPGDENSVTEYIRWFYYNNPKRVGVCYESR